MLVDMATPEQLAECVAAKAGLAGVRILGVAKIRTAPDPNPCASVSSIVINYSPENGSTILTW
jgi:hypothetical protein